ncbi:TPA: hypothetical protein L4T92_001382 [Pseudomonas aeruginosa]|nr:hypothetical protein [Pseudomonas aeruginosa]
MSKDLNKAPVEQAGVDERAAFESSAEDAGSDISRDDFGNYVNVYVQTEWEGWQARAALAQPSPVSEPLIYACKSLAQITSYDGSGHADLALAVLRMAGVGDDERELLVDEWKAARAWKPSPAQAEQAEAERPEVVARVVHSNPIVLGQCGPLNANDELMTVAQHAASVARWAEMFNRVEQEREAALARVAELEKQEPVATVAKVPGEDWNGLHFYRDLQGMQPGTKLYTAPVAQAKHGVPGKYDDVLLPFLKLMEHELHANAEKGDSPGWLQMDRKTALLEIYYHLGKLQKATRDNDPAGIVEYAADVANMAMMLVDVCGLLAAAPGKEGV